MKVAVVSSFMPGYYVGLEESYVRALEATGHQVLKVELPRDDRRLPRRVKQLVEGAHAAAAQGALARRISEAAPDLVLVIKGRGLLAPTVAAWRRLGLRVVNLFPDSPFEGASVDFVARTLLPQFHAVDRVFVHDRFAVGQLRQIGVRADFIAFARDPWIHDITGAPAGTPADPIVFIGNPDAERIRYLRPLVDLGLGLYGQWEWARLHPSDPLARCVRGGVQLGPDMVRTMRSARLSINILRKSQKTAHNMRTFETPACGVCSLSEASVGVQELLEPGREVVVFRTPEELRKAAIQLLKSPSTIDDITQAGHARVEHQTYVQRVHELLSML